jgi:hypothetical protein
MIWHDLNLFSEVCDEKLQTYGSRLKCSTSSEVFSAVFSEATNPSKTMRKLIRSDRNKTGDKRKASKP